MTAPVARQSYFLTGTDTDVGKTFVSCVLLARAAAQGYRCFAIKPISAGCVQDEQGEWQSDDANRLKKYASVPLIDELIAPIKLPTAASPHIAAALNNERLQAARVVGHVRAGLSTKASHIIVEGAGGWRVPINQQECISDVAKQLRLPVILVVGIRLGCLNHALLTAESIARDGLVLAGWVANHLAPDTAYANEQVDTLKKKINAPCLGEVAYLENNQIDASVIDQIRWPLEV